MSSHDLPPQPPPSPQPSPQPLATPEDDVPVALREPVHQVSPRAVPYWRVAGVIELVIELAVVGAIWFFWDSRPWWVSALLIAGLVLSALHTLIAPPIRFRVHRWEVTDDAVHTRSGWLNIEERIAPLSRVQTVDSSQSFLQRLFKLRSLTITTASSAGDIDIACLDEQEAKRLVAELTAITSANRGDAT